MKKIWLGLIVLPVFACASGIYNPGNVGDYVTSNSNSNTACPTSGNFGDLTSIILSTGDWITAGVVRFNALSASTFTGAELGISVTSGNSSAGLTATDNYVPLTFQSSLETTNNAFPTIAIPMYRLSLSVTTTVYLKYSCGYTGTAPGANGSIKAVRVK